MRGALPMALLALVAQSAASCERYRPRPIAIPAFARYLTPDGRVRVVGYNDMTEMMAAMGAAFTVRQPTIRFDFVLKGTRTGPPALTAGTSAFAPMGAEFTTADLAAWRAAHEADPVVVRIAHDSVDLRALSSPLGIYVNAANPLARMTMADVRRAFTDDLDWADLGVGGVWAQRPVHPIGLAPDLALALFMQSHVLGGVPFAPGYRGVAKSRPAIEAIAADPLAIGYANISHADARVRLITLQNGPGTARHDGSARDIASGNYPLDRHLLLYAARSGRKSVAGAFLDFALSCDGQSIVGRGSLGYQRLAPKLLAGERRHLPPD